MEFILKILFSVFGVAGLLWWGWAALTKGRDEPLLVVAKWIGTAALVFVYVGAAGAGVFGVLVGVICGLLLGIIWRHQLTDFFANPVGNLFDGGREKIEDRPHYSRAEGLRMQGRYEESLREVERQMERFPEDFEGLMLMARVRAEHLNQLGRAVQHVEDALRNRKLVPMQITYALSTLADWQLKYGLDPDAARACFQRILTLFPDSEAAQRAGQRIAKLKSREAMREEQVPRTITMPQFERDLGLKGKRSAVKPPEVRPDELVPELLQQLEAFPNDWEARERLAASYATHYHRLDLAAEQIDLLAANPRAPKQEVARWLHQLADWQCKLGGDVAGARATLERIIARYPRTAVASRAETAIQYLRAPKL